MRNLNILQDSLFGIHSSKKFISLATNHANNFLYLLSDDGLVLCLENRDYLALYYSILLNFENKQEDWFQIDYVSPINSLVCISYQGSIACLDESINQDGSQFVEQIGEIEGGIAAAKWHPDYSSLVILTNNNTLLLMSNTWDVLVEIDYIPKAMNSWSNLSWKGDGELLSIVTQDLNDGQYRVRILNQQLEILSLGRNVAEGPAAHLKYVGKALAFANNGSYLAIHQKKPGNNNGHQIVLLEKNGLRHGEFDLRIPHLDLGFQPWDVQSIAWDLSNTLLCVELRSYSDSDKNLYHGCIQIYYRENYYWYCKQQWKSTSMTLLGFDPENANRMFLMQQINQTSIALRTIDLTWSISGSETRDGSVTVVDGNKLHFTPLGYHSVPPPMSMHQLTLESWNPIYTTACSKFVNYWTIQTSKESPHPTSFTWGMASLLDDQGNVIFAMGDIRGKPTKGPQLHLKNILLSYTTNELEKELIQILKFRNIIVTEAQDQITFYLLANCPEIYSISYGNEMNKVHPIGASTTDISDIKGDCLFMFTMQTKEFYSLSTETSYGQSLTSMQVKLVFGFPGAILAITPVLYEENTIALGINNLTTSDYEVIKFSFDKNAELLMSQPHQLDSFFWMDLLTQVISTIPEMCSQLTVISNQYSPKKLHREKETVDPILDFDEIPHLVIGLSLRNRLYCGEVLLVAGASSYIYDKYNDLLLFITLGTQPHLHFSSFQLLTELHPIYRGNSDEQILFECAEPRPIERGGRLVASIYSHSKVIIQLPRGNLEIFEPRPMVLTQIQALINEKQYYQALISLRRQRIDLNYLIDYQRLSFYQCIPDLLLQCFEQKNDLLSLLITALDNNDSVRQKYPIFLQAENLFHYEQDQLNQSKLQEFILQNYQLTSQGMSKVNLVCSILRHHLLLLLPTSQDNKSRYSSIIHAILCTFAKQQPPLLVEAIQFINTQIINPTSSSTVHASLSHNAIAMNALKYLVFLVDGQELFDAALGICDYEMAKSIARNCQMDPKVYLPLLERFEAIGRGFTYDSLQVLYMHYRVNHHLQRYLQCIDWFFQYYDKLSNDWDKNLESNNTSLSLWGDMSLELVDIISKENLFLRILTKLCQIEQSWQENEINLSPFIQSMQGFMTKIRAAYANKCVQEMNYREGVNAYLATYPPNVNKAVEVALTQGNWLKALAIAGRFASSANSQIDPKKIAQEIVSSFQQNQELFNYATALEDELTQKRMTITPSLSKKWPSDQANSDEISNKLSSSSSSMIEEDFDRPLLAAKLSIDYCEDPESAINILITAHKWQPAIEIACQHNRRDLLDEIFASGRNATEELMELLQERTKKVERYVKELFELWKNPQDRIDKISSTDVTLFNELNEPDDQEEQGKEDETKSEFSAITRYSSLSLRSSTSSIRSGASTVSILSCISDKNTCESSSDVGKDSSFSIEGLDHSLLSRGKLSKYEENINDQYKANGGKKVYKRDQTPRRQKRIERSKTKGQGKDVWGLKREFTLCEELWGFAHVKFIAKSVLELSDLLLSTNDMNDRFLAMQLQQKMQLFVKTLQDQILPFAPGYPRDWLIKRAMTSILHFQDPKLRIEARLTKKYLENGVSNTLDKPMILLADYEIEDLIQIKTWWQIAAEGIKYWFDVRSTTLQL